jgi:hypothetical protein
MLITVFIIVCNFINEYHHSTIKKTLKMKPLTKQWFFYQQIGKVFYSIAAVDKTVRPEEIKELKKILQKSGCLSIIL